MALSSSADENFNQANAKWTDASRSERYAGVSAAVYWLALREYYLSWHYLGHPPLTNGNDDPACIDGSSWMYPLVAIALIGLYPTTPIALLSNIAYIVYYRPSAVQASIRLYTLVGFWLGVFVLIYRDPQKVMVWWLD